MRLQRIWYLHIHDQTENTACSSNLQVSQKTSSLLSKVNLQLITIRVARVPNICYSKDLDVAGRKRRIFLRSSSFSVDQRITVRARTSDSVSILSTLVVGVYSTAAPHNLGILCSRSIHENN